LDESQNRTLVIVPNYLGSQPNCLNVSRLYNLCCRSECEALMGELERSIAAPSATPQAVLDVMAGLSSDTTQAPPKLPKQMHKVLAEIAVQQGGRVILHSRLFAQWMHHAFPDECPFPHLHGTTDPVTPDEWVGKETKASLAEIEFNIEQAKMSESSKSTDLTWDFVDEVLSYVSFEHGADSSLERELKGERSLQKLADFQNSLRPMYVALGGDLQMSAVRYALHRFFVHQHGWYIQGLEPAGDVYSTKAEKNTTGSWIPAYMLHRMEERMGRRGLDLHDLAAVAAAVDDMVHLEAVKTLLDVYEILGLDDETNLPKERAHDVLLLYLMLFLSNVPVPSERPMPDFLPRLAETFMIKFPAWAEQKQWLLDLEGNSTSGRTDFKTMALRAYDIVTHYSSYNDKECRNVKRTLMGIQVQAGRVNLADFYKMGLVSRYEFTEKVEYLRTLGALDESVAGSVKVIIPNYLVARPNCLNATGLLLVCCRNECEDLMGALEEKVAALDATASEILTLAANLSTDTVMAPRQLKTSLVERLHRIASQGNGKIRLHGRLFAQWMHHAFPNECPYPHEGGTTSPQTPDEWMGVEVAASEEERQKVVDDACAADSFSGSLPWDDQEVMLSRTVSHRSRQSDADMLGERSKRARGGVFSLLRALVKLAAAILILAAVPVREKVTLQAKKMGFSQQVLVVLILAVIAWICNLLDGAFFAIVVTASLCCSGVAKWQCSPVGKGKQHSKCLV